MTARMPLCNFGNEGEMTNTKVQHLTANCLETDTEVFLLSFQFGVFCALSRNYVRVRLRTTLVYTHNPVASN